MSIRKTAVRIPCVVAARFGRAAALPARSVAAADPGATVGCPTRTIRMPVGFAPGGGTDVMARMSGQMLSEAWGRNVVVDDRIGAGGNIATEIAARALPGGHTLPMAVSSVVINECLCRRIGYGTPRAIAATHYAGIGRVLQWREVRERFAAPGFEWAHDEPACFAALIRSDHAKWAKVVRDSGARAD